LVCTDLFSDPKLSFRFCTKRASQYKVAIFAKTCSVCKCGSTFNVNGASLERERERERDDWSDLRTELLNGE
jgi:hypothetical protein